ncbi:hypothetical protein VFPPC_18057 [Pochonia chlamydosporia 170]|uniref:Uncharacterized protein n=1 Tax=Pochonia chlamydosporia 170 TaxID=1380566 RepID=A0A219AQD7_METCM|nr:hypothetical protein VFPPC_18057 [Pochonia chlamydosporia 170]OWT42802.1 hypothetical protein VFPPC_18057 [Pochonia chlamydosporia 170]
MALQLVQGSTEPSFSPSTPRFCGLVALELGGATSVAAQARGGWTWRQCQSIHPESGAHTHEKSKKAVGWVALTACDKSSGPSHMRVRGTMSYLANLRPDCFVHNLSNSLSHAFPINVDVTSFKHVSFYGRCASQSNHLQ